MGYRHLTDIQFLGLIFSSGDELGKDYIAEARRRKETLVPLLCEILEDDHNYKLQGDGFWCVVHAVHTLGIIGDIKALDTLLTALEYATVFDNDWLWEALPECFLRMGPQAVPRLQAHIEAHRNDDIPTVLAVVDGLWNIWDVYPETRLGIENFFLQIITAAADSYSLRTQLMYDFVEIGRTDLRPFFEQYFKLGEYDPQIMQRKDLDELYLSHDRTPGYRNSLERFYDLEEIEKRHKDWADADIRDTERFILENFHYIAHSDACPCGSGKKFKKCHYGWAKEAIERRNNEYF